MIIVWPMVGIALSFGFGIFVSDHLPSLGWVVILLLPVLLLVTYRLRRTVWQFPILMLCVFALLGYTHHFVHRFMAFDDVRRWVDTKVSSPFTVRGLIDSEPRTTFLYGTPKISFELKVRELKRSTGWQPVRGRILVQMYQQSGIRFGDEVVLKGKISRPFEFSREPKFSYREYLKRKDIYLVLYVRKDAPVEGLAHQRGFGVIDRCLGFRQWAHQVFLQTLGPVNASLMAAMLLGQQADIPTKITESFRQTGTAHILAISGLNVGIVVGVLFILFRMVPGPRQMAYALTMLGIGIFVGVTGASASVVRAGVMAGVLLSGALLERQSQPINSLGFAGFIILLFNPNSLFDIGFQLSFISVLTILLFYPLIHQEVKPLLERVCHLPLRWVAESMILTVAASLGVGGLISYYFHMITPISILANLIIVPLSSLLVILGMGLLFFAWICPWAVGSFALCVKLVVTAMVASGFWFKQWPHGYLYITDISPWQAVGYYLMVLSLWLFLLVRAGSHAHEKARQIDIDTQL